MTNTRSATLVRAISYPLWIRVRGQRTALVWQTDDGTAEAEGDSDCVLVRDGRIVSVRTPEELAPVAQEYGLELEEGTDEPQDLDGLAPFEDQAKFMSDCGRSYRY